MKKTIGSWIRSSVLPALCILFTSSSVAADSALSPGARVAIIGDSITEQKLYSKYMEAYLVACSGVPDVKVFQFGWGGETAEGFANRLQNDLSVFQPTVATTCYGMNDGQYRPYAENIGKPYEANMRNVVEGLRKAGVQQIVIGSPGAVDTHFFVRNNFKPLSGADGYNQNLGTLRDIGRRLATEMGTRFADVHQPMLDAMGKAKAALGAEYDVCGKDGFHPGPNGHLIMAYAFLRALGCDGRIGEITVDMNGRAVASAGHQVKGGTGGRAELESTRYPFCFEGDAKSSGGTRSIAPFLPFNEELNQFTLKVKNLGASKATVTWGQESKEFTREQLAAGVNLAAEFDRTPFDADFRRLVQAVGTKQNFETMMIKNMVTHFRPFANEARDDAELAAAFKKTGERLSARQQELDAEMRKTLTPVKHTISVVALP
jgi:lysophospholipase L1-like esterase